MHPFTPECMLVKHQAKDILEGGGGWRLDVVNNAGIISGLSSGWGLGL